MTTNYNLYNADTDLDMGPATPNQIAASLATGDTGIILVDEVGTPVAPDSFAARTERTFRVYVA